MPAYPAMYLKFLIDGADGYMLTWEAKYTLNEYKVRDFNISPLGYHLFST